MVLKANRKKLTPREVRQTLGIFKNTLIDHNVPLQDVILFGSYAKGTAHNDSDIDVAVILPNGWLLKSQRVADDIPWIAKQIQVKLEPHLMTRRDLQNPYLALVKEIKQYGRAI